MFEKDIFYYHNDHLGSTSYISTMNGQLSQHVEYIPFGEVLFEEHSSSISMPYLFNGKELDRETNLTYYGARYLDMKTSLWLNIDPLAEKFPNWSPYCFVMNNPLRLIDPTGMAPEDIIIIGNNKQQLKYENGNLFNKDGSAYTGKVDKFTQKTVDALGQISKSAEGSAMIQELQSSKNTFTIEKGSDNSFTPDNQRASYSNIPEIQSAIPSLITSSGSGGKIIFNPSTTTSGFNTAGNTNRPSFIGLAHEMVHGRDSNNGVLYPYTDFNSFKGEFNGLYKSEWRSTFYENTIRGQLGVPLRSSYGVSDDGQGNFAPIGPSLLDSSKKPINYTIK